jgi:aromatic amino acid aminotransferase I
MTFINDYINDNHPSQSKVSNDDTNDDLPLAKDFNAYYSTNARNLGPSPLKSLTKYMLIPDLISLGAGLPHPETFPFTQLSVSTKDHDVTGKSMKSVSVSVESSDLPSDFASDKLPLLNTALQYGDGRGLLAMRKFFTEETRRLHSPRYANWDVVITGGNTEGFSKAVSLFCSAGDTLIVEEWCYPAALKTIQHINVACCPVSMDEYGMLPESLRETVTSWKGNTPLRVVYLVSE